MDGQWADGAQETEYGLILRVASDGDNGPKFYTFSVSPLGYYSVWVRSGGKWKPLVQWQASDAVLTGMGDVNHLTVVADGSSFSFSVNDVVVAEITDKTVTTGYFGVYAGSVQTAGVTAAFDNFSLGPIQ